MRTTAEIVARIKELESSKDDFFSFQRSVLLAHLSFDDARQFLDKEKVDANIEQVRTEWNSTMEALTRERIMQEMKEYMEFAVDKVLNHRGLSANRSVDKFKAYLYLLADDELLGKIDRDEIRFENYGAPILRAIAGKYDLGVVEMRTRAFINMSQSRPCREDGCDEGCGRSFSITTM